jgi:hypothetical protein
MGKLPLNQELVDEQMYEDESSMFGRARFMQVLKKNSHKRFKSLNK